MSSAARMRDQGHEAPVALAAAGATDGRETRAGGAGQVVGGHRGGVGPGMDAESASGRCGQVVGAELIRELGQSMRHAVRQTDDPAVVAEMLTQVSLLLGEMAPRAVRRDPKTGHRLAQVSGPLVRAVGGSTGPFFGQLLTVYDQAEGLTALSAADIDQDEDWRRAAATECAGFLADRFQIDFGRARRLTTLGSCLRAALPKTAEMLCRGDIHTDQVDKLVKHAAATEATREALARPVPAGRSELDQGQMGGPLGHGAECDQGYPAQNHTADDDGSSSGPPGSSDSAGSSDLAEHQVAQTVEEELLHQARQTSPRKLAQQLARWKHRTDPDTLERAHERALAHEFVNLRYEGEECVLSGRFTTERGQVVAGALKRIIGVPSAKDTRSAGKRRADALVALAQIDADLASTTNTGRVRPLIAVNISFESLQALAERTGTELPAQLADDPACWAETDGPIPPSVLERLACDSAIARVVFGPGNEIINAGTTIRTANPAQRRAVIARDRQCIFPDCATPPRLCEIHHLDEWIRHSGPTNVANLALLCWRHHHVIHACRLRVHRANGIWHFVRPDGSDHATSPRLARPPRNLEEQRTSPPLAPRRPGKVADEKAENSRPGGGVKLPANGHIATGSRYPPEIRGQQVFPIPQLE